MATKRITIVGAGNVGATAAYMAAEKQLGDIVLLDIVNGLAQGKALDIAEAAPVGLYSTEITGTTDWQKTADSDISIVTSGLARKPGMTRDDLLVKNVQIVKQVCENIKEYSPDSIIIVVSNPLDAMVYTAAKASGFPESRILGMAGALDSARFCCFLAAELGVNAEQIKCVLMGGHGDDMVPLPRFTSVNGIPVTELLEKAKLDELIDRTRNGGIEIVDLLGSSAFIAPAAGAVQIAEAIIRDKKSIISCCAYCAQQYDVGGYFICVPVLLGKNGLEKVIELDLNTSERAMFEESLSHVKQLANAVDRILEK